MARPKKAVLDRALLAAALEGLLLQKSHIEEQIRQSILRFEPRIDPKTVEVRIGNDMSTGLRPTSLRLTIKGQMWNQPVPLELLLSADVDVDTGQAAVRDLRA